MTRSLRDKLREISALCLSANDDGKRKPAPDDQRYRCAQHLAPAVLAIVRRKEQRR